MQYLLLFVLFILFPICGFQSLQKGEFGSAIFFFFPLFVLICALIVNLCVVEPRKKREKALHKMFNLPEYVRNDYGEKWDQEFQKVIVKAIETTSDSAKLSDLQHCQKVAKEMIKDSGRYRLDRPFYLINKAFLLTGCHVTITDSHGQVITKII